MARSALVHRCDRSPNPGGGVIDLGVRQAEEGIAARRQYAPVEQWSEPENLAGSVHCSGWGPLPGGGVVDLGGGNAGNVSGISGDPSSDK